MARSLCVQVIGIIATVTGLLSFIPSNGQINWFGVAFGLLIGIPATLASTMYNPCLCCPCGAPGKASFAQLRTIAILSAVAAVVALAGTVACAAVMAQISSWPMPREYTCCNVDAVCSPKGCTSPAGGGKYDCIAGGPWPPFENKEEPMTCREGQQAEEITIHPKNEKNFKNIKNFVLTATGIGLAIYLLCLFATAPAAWLTWKEAKESQMMEQTGGP
jgi:hypothetical protein